MLNNLSKYISKKLVANEIILISEEQLYSYAIYCMIIKYIPIFIVVIVGIYLNCIVGAITVIWSFLYIRKYNGGYHATTCYRCMVLSIVILGIAVRIATMKLDGIIEIILLAICIILILMYSPKNSDSREYSDYELLIFRRKKNLRILFVLCVWFISEKTNCFDIRNGIMSTCYIVAITNLLSIVHEQKKKQLIT